MDPAVFYDFLGSVLRCVVCVVPCRSHYYVIHYFIAFSFFFWVILLFSLYYVICYLIALSSFLWPILLFFLFCYYCSSHVYAFTNAFSSPIHIFTFKKTKHTECWNTNKQHVLPLITIMTLNSRITVTCNNTWVCPKAPVAIKSFWWRPGWHVVLR